MEGSRIAWHKAEENGTDRKEIDVQQVLQNLREQCRNIREAVYILNNSHQSIDSVDFTINCFFLDLLCC